MFPFPKELELPDYRLYLCSATELEASYDRCRALEVPVELDKPQIIIPKVELATRLAANSLLIIAAERVITLHHYAGPQNDHIYILCDQELVALKIFASPEVLTATDEAGIKPGTVFTKESCGTNALALAKEHNRLVAVRGEQHYCELFKNWWCVAGPVKDSDGRILGYLDISMHAEKELGTTAVLLSTLIGSIEKDFLLLNLHQDGGRPHLLTSLPPEAERKLTLREGEITELLVSRLTNQEIAKKLHLSIRTVRTHRQNIYEKLGVSSSDELLSRFDPQ